MADTEEGSIFSWENPDNLPTWYDNAIKKHKESFPKKAEVISRYDFLPIVKINNSEESKNAIISIKECENCKKEKINLGKDYDKDKQEYIVAEIVITQNSTTKIPLIVKRGYDPIGLQDEDGILKFTCNNGDVKIKMIANDDTDYGKDEKEYDLKDAKYGDEFVLEIAPTKLKRGSKFTVTFSASDDDDGLGTTSKRVGICGKFNFTVIQDDVFMEEEIKPLENLMKIISDNINTKPKEGEYRESRNYCVFAADRYIGALLNNNKKFYTYDDESGEIKHFESLLSGTIRAKKIDEYGYVKKYIIYQDKELFVPIQEKIQKIKNDLIYDAVGIKKGKLMKFINESIDNKLGYHIYYTTYSDDFHVQTLIIDNRNPCDAIYKIIDQHGETSSSGKLIDIEDGFVRQSSWTFCNFYLNHDKKSFPKTTTSLWKIQR